MEEQQLLIGWILILSVISFFSGRHLWSIPKKCTAFANAIIVRVIRVSASKRPVFRYTITDGTEIEKTSLMKDVRFQEGQTVALHYNPQKPTQFVMNSGSSYKFLGIFLMAVGIILLALFLYLLNCLKIVWD